MKCVNNNSIGHNVGKTLNMIEGGAARLNLFHGGEGNTTKSVNVCLSCACPCCFKVMFEFPPIKGIVKQTKQFNNTEAVLEDVEE